MLRCDGIAAASKHAGRSTLLGLSLTLLFALSFVLPALAQTFLALSGRVVDGANLLKPEERGALEAKLKAHEDRTSDQVVVATVASLGGFEVEDYANRLFRAWKLGTAKNNGLLLLVAPNERKVRIEVGYGLEGAMTDALSGIVIRTAIAPKFKAGDYAGGINAGVDGILSVLSGDAEEWQRKPRIRQDEDSGTIVPFVLLFGIVVLVIVLRARARAKGLIGGPRPYRQRSGTWLSPGPSSWSSGSSWGSGSSSWSGGSSGGFSGGGGSSGGGGASGSW